ncbi:MAG: VOC family protein [Sphingomonadales bacterium]|nr:VOC family protein [Sphingomonadales bacterium]
MTEAPALRLGYLLIESERLDQWEVFARDGLGLHADRLSSDLLALRLDDRERRIMVRRGSAEDVVALGWETDDPAALEQMHAHLTANGISPTSGTAREAQLRGVEGFCGFEGHKGLRFEFFSNAKRTNAALDGKVSGFVTGTGGLGHVALFTRKPEALTEDMQRLLGARLSDRITDRIMGLEMEFTFLHLNERHHSLAIAATAGLRLNPIRTRAQHLMLEAETLEDVGDAYLRCKQLGFQIAMGMGQHPNDLGLSFYVVSPSGFEVELGHEPRKIGPEWEVRDYRGISKWGHQPEFRPSLGEKMKSGWTALRSLVRQD